MHLNDSPAVEPRGVSFIDQANCLRALALNTVKAGFRGKTRDVAGMSEVALALWSGHLRHNPANPAWPNRDRFVMSQSRTCFLLTSLLHLTGYELSLSSLDSNQSVQGGTGQAELGLAKAVDVALTEKLLADEFNQPGHCLVNHHTYVFLDSACLTNSRAREACRQAGVWRLNKLIALYEESDAGAVENPDSAAVSATYIDGWQPVDTAARFRLYGWNVIGPIDGNDAVAVGQAIALAKVNSNSPTLILCQNYTQSTRETLRGTQRAYEIPRAIRAKWDARALGAKREAQWQAQWQRYQREYPALAAEFEQRAASRPADCLQVHAVTSQASVLN